MELIRKRAVGGDRVRVEGHDKVTGAAVYAFEAEADDVHYVWPVQATIARGAVRSVDGAAALAQPGVVVVLDSTNAPRLRPDAGDPATYTEPNPALNVLQHPEVFHRGQIVAAVVATSLEAAREAAGMVIVGYHEEAFKADFDPADPEAVPVELANLRPGTTVRGDVDTALAAADLRLDLTYRTPAEHASPMEPHASTAIWQEDGSLVLYDGTQGPSATARIVAGLFGLPPTAVRVIADHVGGGFGSKAVPWPGTVLAPLAARAVGKPVKFAMSRQQMFSLTSHRAPTIQRVQIGAGRDGRIAALDHDALQHCSRPVRYSDQTVFLSTEMYDVPNLRARHRTVHLDVPMPGWMRAPGEAPGMFALESALDEVACELRIDPVELRVINEPAVDPAGGLPFSSRGLVACLREGARRFGWHDRDPEPGVRRDGRWLIGSGVASASYPAAAFPSSASARACADGTYEVAIAGVDIGTGARTALAMIAADALETSTDQVRVLIGRSDLPDAIYAGGSIGTSSWGWAVAKACRTLLRELAERAQPVPQEGFEVVANTAEDIGALRPLARAAYGAHFARVKVDVTSGEVRVDRMVGVFAAGQIVNARGARSQLQGGMIMGVSMALHEHLVMDPRYGDFANHDFASYHFSANADIPDLEVHWLDEHDADLNPIGAKGLGEIGIVGAAAAVANAVHHATGIRVRDLPITLEKLIGRPSPV